MELKIVGGDDNLTRVALSGKLDVAGEGAIGEQFRALVETSNTSFLVDMSQVTYLASWAYASSSLLQKHLRAITKSWSCSIRNQWWKKP